MVLTAGVLEPLDDDQVKRVGADATLKKPFEASVLIATVKPLAERAAQERAQPVGGTPDGKTVPVAKPAVTPFVIVVDAEQVRAAVTVALDAAMEHMVDEITLRVLAALQTRRSPSLQTAPVPAAQELSPTPKPAPAPTPASPALRPVIETSTGMPASAPPRLEFARRVNPLRSRPGSILGLDLSYSEPEVPASAPRSAAPDPLFPNARPAADPDPGSRPGVSNPRPAADPDPGSRPAIPDKK